MRGLTPTAAEETFSRAYEPYTADNGPEAAHAETCTDRPRGFLKTVRSVDRMLASYSSIDAILSGPGINHAQPTSPVSQVTL